jgi:hypothetical protein
MILSIKKAPKIHLIKIFNLYYINNNLKKIKITFKMYKKMITD